MLPITKIYSCLTYFVQVQNVSQLKYVTDEDLHSIGMAKPEIRRLKKFFQKHFPQNYLSKIKKVRVILKILYLDCDQSCKFSFTFFGLVN